MSKSARVGSVLAAASGLAVGYLAWLGAVAAVIATTPVYSWVAASGVVLVLLGGAAFVFGRHFSGAARQFFWWSPLLPVLASIYTLAVLAL